MNIKIVTEKFVELFTDYPLYSQEHEKDSITKKGIIKERIICCYSHIQNYSMIEEKNKCRKRLSGILKYYYRSIA